MPDHVIRKNIRGSRYVSWVKSLQKGDVRVFFRHLLRSFLVLVPMKSHKKQGSDQRCLAPINFSWQLDLPQRSRCSIRIQVDNGIRAGWIGRDVHASAIGTHALYKNAGDDSQPDDISRTRTLELSNPYPGIDERWFCRDFLQSRYIARNDEPLTLFCDTDFHATNGLDEFPILSFLAMYRD